MSCLKGNFHEQFLGGLAGAIPPGYPAGDGNVASLPDTMKLTVLDQYAKGLVHCDAVLGEEIREKIERLKWSLWHGNLYKALYKIDDIESLLYNFEET